MLVEVYERVGKSVIWAVKGSKGLPKGGITENVGRIQRGATQICLENEDMGEGVGIAKVINSYHFSEVTFKGGTG